MHVDEQVGQDGPDEPDQGGQGGQGLSVVGSLFRDLRRSASNEPSEDARAAVAELFPAGPELVEYLLRFCSLIVLSASIAAFGLLADSAGVVIGAMLVAPLMTPILATAAATVQALNRQLLGSLLVIALGTALAILVGYLVSALAGNTVVGGDLPGEVEARTFPGLLDLGIAISAGAAAGYILPRRSATSALPGVGIAVALVPPLATVGITRQLGETEDSWNAFLLFVTNLAAIVFAASVMLLLAGFRPYQIVSRRVLFSRVLLTLSGVVVVAVPLSIHTRTTVEDGQLRGVVVDAVSAWESSVRIVGLQADVRGGRAVVELLVAGPNPPDDVWQLAERISSDFGKPVDLELQYSVNQRFRVSVR